MLKDIKILKNSAFKDNRGMLWTTWKKGVFKNIKFNHDKFSLSKKNVLRGLHCDFKSWKMITSVYGKFLFVVIDMRKKLTDYEFEFINQNNDSYISSLILRRMIFERSIDFRLADSLLNNFWMLQARARVNI